jgi:cyclophilin family peptidyl-prolyl cis-trans isomerase
VRLRALDLADSTCAADAALLTTLRTWIDKLPADASRRAAGGVSWHAAAHGIVALARLQPAEARTRLPKLSAHAQWQVRAYAARAAAVLTDATTLRRLATDRHDNVREVAIRALGKLTGHTDDALYLATISNPAIGAQAGRAAAAALKGSPRADVASAASAAFDRWAGKNVASARDVRLALLDAAGRPATDDRPPVSRSPVPPTAVALAMGAPVRLRVTIAPASGGGTFVVRLRGDLAPLMAARIDQAVRQGYYRGLTWHRVEPDFVIQGGSPAANEYVGSREFLRDELGTVPHLRGTVGMSTRGHDTGDYQWFVNLKDNLRLNPDYTIFGEVTEGIDIVDGILEGDVIQSIDEIPEGHD